MYSPGFQSVLHHLAFLVALRGIGTNQRSNMRIPRSWLLDPHVAFHKMWQAHDHQHLLAAPETKRDYLDQLFRFKPRATREGVKLYAYCVMDNHVHECGAIGDRFEPLSEWMRVAHGTFAQRFNKRVGRRGKVAIERPKTVVLEDDRAVLQVMLYLDANPVVAGLVADAGDWPWSSHGFYAYGTTDTWTKHLDPPDAYLALGETPVERQQAYRKCYEAYVGCGEAEHEAPTDRGDDQATQPSRGPATEAAQTPGRPRCPSDNPESGVYFGSHKWMLERRCTLLIRLRKRREGRARERPQERVEIAA
jgi:putative transposase